MILINHSKNLNFEAHWVEEVMHLKHLNRFSVGYILELIARRLELKIKLKKTNKALRELEKKEDLPAIVFNSDGWVKTVNKACVKLLRFDNSEHLKVVYRDSLLGVNHNAHPIIKSIKDEKPIGFKEVKMFFVNSDQHELEYEVKVNYEDDKDLFHVFIYEGGLSRRARERKGIHYDFLTNLPNRFEVTQILAKELVKAVDENRQIGIVTIDIDDFKLINEGFGHESGDLVIKQTVRRLENALPNSIVIGRLGSDEFVALFNNIRNEEDLKWEVDRINEAFLLPFDVAEQDVRITCSFGSLIMEDKETTADEAMRMSSTALHQAKKQGGGHILAYDEEMKKESENRFRLVIEMERGLRESEFEVHYQPIVRLEDDKMLGFEALIRWNHPEKGMIPPGMFIELAEKTNLIIPMGRWLLQEVGHQAKKWNEIYPLFASVNASPNQFLKGNFLEDVLFTMDETNLPAKNLKIEITEGLAIKNIEYGKKVLNDLARVGVEVSMDDFGTGYSSLAYLRSFPFRTLKIDMAFIRRLEESHEDREIVKAIISMANTLKLKTVAEGVETSFQKLFLRDAGCELFQGYLYSRPIPANEFEELIKKQLV